MFNIPSIHPDQLKTSRRDCVTPYRTEASQ